MKLIQPSIVTSEPAKRQKTDVRPVVAVEAIERSKSGSSHSTSYSPANSRLPGKFAEQNYQAIHSYLNTASLDGDDGELIGIDTYA